MTEIRVLSDADLADDAVLRDYYELARRPSWRAEPTRRSGADFGSPRLAIDIIFFSLGTAGVLQKSVGIL